MARAQWTASDTSTAKGRISTNTRRERKWRTIVDPLPVKRGQCLWVRHAHGLPGDVLQYIDALASKDPDRFVWASTTYIAKNARSGVQSDRRYVGEILAEFQLREMIIPAQLSRRGRPRSGFIVPEHDVWATKFQSKCMWKKSTTDVAFIPSECRLCPSDVSPFSTSNEAEKCAQVLDTKNDQRQTSGSDSLVVSSSNEYSIEREKAASFPSSVKAIEPNDPRPVEGDHFGDFLEQADFIIGHNHWIEECLSCDLVERLDERGMPSEVVTRLLGLNYPTWRTAHKAQTTIDVERLRWMGNGFLTVLGRPMPKIPAKALKRLSEAIEEYGEVAVRFGWGEFIGSNESFVREKHHHPNIFCAQVGDFVGHFYERINHVQRFHTARLCELVGIDLNEEAVN